MGHPREQSDVVLPKPLLNNDVTRKSGERHHKANLPTAPDIRRFSLDVNQEHVDQSSWSESCYEPRRRIQFRNFVGPNRRTSPRYDTVIWNLIVLVTFFSSLCLAARYPTGPVRIAFVTISGLFFLTLSVSVCIDLVNRGTWKQRKTGLKSSSPEY